MFDFIKRLFGASDVQKANVSPSLHPEQGSELLPSQPVTQPKPAIDVSVPEGMALRAYDLEILPQDARSSDSENHGWVFGLPPGIKPEQWPLDPVTGYPLMHGFTLYLPEDYRVHGPDIVAFSFFATAADQGDGGANPVDETLRGVILNPAATPPTDADLIPFWNAARTAHPRLHRMQDILDYEYAVILLTQEEFDGAYCKPAELVANRFYEMSPEPVWIKNGSAYTEINAPPDDCFTQSIQGTPEKSIEYSRAIRWTPRANDPNAGKTPMESYDEEPTPSGYQQPWYLEDDQYKDHSWAEDHAENHIGGTMMPIQAMPEMSTFYVEFEEDFGIYNFGTGNAQLDFKNMVFDWACG